MAFSTQTYTADGVGDTFNIPFNYIDTLHIQVKIDDVIDTGITFPTASTVKTSSVPSNGATVEVRRITPNSSLLVDFQDGSTLTEADLDKSAQQLFFVVQEALDNLVTEEQVTGLIVSGQSIDFPTIVSGDAGKGLQVKTSETGYELFTKGSLSTQNTVDTADIEDNAITTAKIANDAVTNNTIADAAVDTTQLADDAISLAKLDSGTAGNLITYDASGDPATVSTGTNGQVLTSNGAGAAPTFQTLSSSVFTNSYSSSAQTITSAGSLTLAHGLGAEPKLVITIVECTTAEHGYAIGDRIYLGGSHDNHGNSTGGYALWVDSSNLNIRFGSFSTAIIVTHKTSGTRAELTNGNWDMYFYAYA